ncbi:protein ripply2-like isoform X1 [Acanthopagrus latus]|uniref:protein ripply2-like isoform X1 n=1 Tax=Acanthopagrus latus TaxID=8177 RepID=UPI00187BCA5F|nr:protein ripply2-like isoform X1 [Acanthopagrus latus]
MESFATNNGLPSLPIGGNVTQQPGLFWRPWTGITAAHTAESLHGDLSAAKHSKTPQFVHPVKLMWPKSKCFDHLYQDAEVLLRNYPVQATICVYTDISSDEDSDDDDEEEAMEKDLN